MKGLTPTIKPLQNLHVPLTMRPLFKDICMPLYLYPTKNWCYMYMVVRPLKFAFTARIISLVPRAISKLCPPSENFPTPCAKFKMKFCALCRRRRDSTESCPYLLSAIKPELCWLGSPFWVGAPHLTENGRRRPEAELARYMWSPVIK